MREVYNLKLVNFYKLFRYVSHLFSVPIPILHQFFKLSIILFCFISTFNIYLKCTINDIQHDTKKKSILGHVNSPSIEIFSAPPPIDNDNIKNLRRTIASWRSLEPRPRITLLGSEQTLHRFASRQRVNSDFRIDHNFLGRPLFNSLIYRTNQSKADIAILINSDILLQQDFIFNLKKLFKKFKHFFAVGARYDVDRIPSVVELGEETLRSYILRVGSLHNYGGMDFWAWTTGGPRLVRQPIPSFNFARGRYDNWLMHEVVSNAMRPVIDLSETVVSIHQRHMYKKSIPPLPLTLSLAPSKFQRNLRSSSQEISSTVNSNFWSRGKASHFELFLNIRLSLESGSYRDSFGTTLHARWKMMHCAEEEGICLVERVRPGRCYCEYTPNVRNVQKEAVLDSFTNPNKFPKTPKVDSLKSYEIPVQVTRYSARNPRFGLPLTLLDALASVIQNGTVIISAINFGYRDVMMNWVCQMRRLGIRNFMVAALDKDLYKYAFVRGIAVYYEDSFEKDISEDYLLREAIYGSDQFRKLTKMKTRVVSRILRLGYDVIWSDCDIVFFRNPLHLLMSTPGDLIVQSNAPDDIFSNGIRRINSGFYLARSSQNLNRAIDSIVNMAIYSNLTEQPCFYDVLCGASGEYRVGKNRCEKEGLITTFLDRELFPNGVTRKVWLSRPGNIPKIIPNAYILHNNWIRGVQNKKNRMQQHGYHMFDAYDNVCKFEQFGVIAK